MDVTRLDDARPYDAPGHFAMLGLRLQGFEASPTESFWLGMSTFLPGGGAQMSATPIEKVYLVLEGEMTVITDEGETVLRRYDSCRLAPGEARAIENRTNLPALMLVVMPYPQEARYGR